MLSYFFSSRDDEKKPLLTRPTTTIHYQTIFSIPYAHVIKDDKIPINSPNVIETDVPETYLLFDSSIHNQEYETGTHHTHINIYLFFV